MGGVDSAQGVAPGDVVLGWNASSVGEIAPRRSTGLDDVVAPAVQDDPSQSMLGNNAWAGKPAGERLFAAGPVDGDAPALSLIHI